MKVLLPIAVSLSFLGMGACTPIQMTESMPSSSAEITGFTYSEPIEIQEEDEDESLYYKSFPGDRNKYVQYWIDHFSEGVGRSDMQRYLARSERYLDLMQSIFRDKGLPEDLVYIVMAESGFNPYARSIKEAVGYWQFIPATGKRYGLNINRYVDDRRDFVLSTKAAALYLKELYSIFEDWRLSMAGYNAGESRVSKAIVYHRSRDFWRLVEKKALPLETRNYVPKVIAMRTIAVNPRAYGFDHVDYQAPLNYDLVALSKSSSLSYISEQLNLSTQEIKNLNPKFKTDTVLVKNRKQNIRVPSNTYN